ncbi:MAG: hypothetical protein ACXVIT_10820, partial [Halobacteriota archaeon]
AFFAITPFTENLRRQGLVPLDRTVYRHPYRGAYCLRCPSYPVDRFGAKPNFAVLDEVFEF